MSRETAVSSSWTCRRSNVPLGGVGGNREERSATSRRRASSPRALVRRTASTTTRCSVPATAARSTPCRGRARCAASTRCRLATATPARTTSFRTARSQQGIPARPNPDVASGNVPLPSWRPHADAGSRQRRARHDRLVERVHRAPAPWRHLAEHGLRRHRHQQRLRRSQPELRRVSGGNASRQYFAQAGTADILLWGSRTKARYHSLQMALNRPFRNGLLLKGAYTFSKALNETDDDGWVGLSWNQPSQLGRNYARAGYDRPHMLQMGFVYELPWLRESSGILADAREELADQRHRVVGLGYAVHGGRRQRPAQPARRHADRQRHGRTRGRLRRSRSERAVVRPVSRSASRATRGATRAATRSADRRTGTSTSRCSGRSRSATTAWSSVRSRPTCSTTRSGATRSPA